MIQSLTEFLEMSACVLTEVAHEDDWTPSEVLVDHIEGLDRKSAASLAVQLRAVAALSEADRSALFDENAVAWDLDPDSLLHMAEIVDLARRK